jgi:3-hydroxyacyl-[acyl-carrier-protein] dehydratase
VTKKVDPDDSLGAIDKFLGLPHRPPFVFVRTLKKCEPGLFANCETWFERDDPMFVGHFPKNPMVPGVILTEALAQTAGIAAAAGAVHDKPRFLLSAIRQMKFFGSVRPEERIQLHAKRAGEAGNLIQFDVEAVVNGKQVAAGQLVLSKVSQTITA